jgi:hypothetical protein
MSFRLLTSRCTLSLTALGMAILLLATSAPCLAADDVPATGDPSTAEETASNASQASGEQSSGEKAAETGAATATPPAAASSSGSKTPDFATVIKDFKKISGLLTLYQTDDKVFAEIPASMLGKEFFVLISIAKGIGERDLLGGMTWGDGDDWIWEFRKVDDKIQVVRRNVRFFADKGSPEEKAVRLAYTDSVLYSVPVATKSPAGADVIDLTPIFLSDLPKISRELNGFSFARDRSTWASVKAFPDNVELEVAATYASSGNVSFDTVPDSRGLTLNVHYSLSLLPQNDYTPRFADDRVGYFVTALKDFSQDVDEDRFVRYINRWRLEKADPKAEISPPKKPIVFWIEKTVPFRYRQPIREGIEAWNKAYEKAGFATAIEVRQQPESTDWDPEDVNYNTFRWITAGAGFAMGPSRVNPRTGQILDADIIFDADFLQFWRSQYETFTPESIARLTGGLFARSEHASGDCRDCESHGLFGCRLADGHAREMALASTVLAATAAAPLSDEAKEKLVVEGLKSVAMHEVGHTLGLRHNFKGSSHLSIEAMNDDAQTATTGLTTSVMDYMPANIVPKGRTQGRYYTPVLGAYDYWAIEYGYKPLPGGSAEAERGELEKIASRSGEPQLAYATDEDTTSADPDPMSNRFDLGNDPVAFARMRAELVAQVIPLITERMTSGEGGYERVRQAFGVLLSAHGQAMYMASRLVGGLHTSRSHRDDPQAPPPFSVVEAQRQRDALAVLEEQVFSEKPFSFSPDLYNQLATTPWLHWGMQQTDRDDYPVHEVVLMWQERILSQLLSPLTLSRMLDNELKVATDADAFTAAELLERLTAAIMTEINALQPAEFTNRKPAIPSLRRATQRAYLERLSQIALGNAGAPADCEAVAALQLRELREKLDGLLARDDLALDTYSRAHLVDSRERIDRVLSADLVKSRP